jgi:hypothetical protein
MVLILGKGTLFFEIAKLLLNENKRVQAQAVLGEKKIHRKQRKRK